MIIDNFSKLVKTDTYDICFKMFHKLSLMRDFAKQVWHGSVLGSILEGGKDLENLMKVTQSICINLSIDESLLSELKEAFEK